MSDVTDTVEWFKSQNINPKWANTIVTQAKKEYPYLYKAVEAAPTNRAKLELIQIVTHVLRERFPVTQRAAERITKPSV